MQFPVLQALEKELAGKVRVRRECEFAHIKPLEQASSLLNRIFEPSTYSRAASVVIQWRPRFSAARAVVPDPAKGTKTISSGRLRNSIILDANAIGMRAGWAGRPARSEEHTSELQSLMRISYAVFCLKKKTNNKITINYYIDSRAHK